MAKQAYFLSPSDHKMVQRLLQRARQGDYDNPRMPPDTNPTLQRSPEVYIARPTEDTGIPALTEEAGTGIGDTPGSAECDIYRINLAGDLEPVGDYSQTVFNLSVVPIPQQWIIVERDKYGAWLAVPDRQFEIIPFELVGDKVPGAYAEANGIDSSNLADPTVVFNVSDQTGGRQWRALGSETLSGSGSGSSLDETPARGICWHNGRSGLYEIIQMREQSRFCCSTLAEDIGYDDTGTASDTITVNDLVPLDGGQVPLTPDVGYNSRGFTGKAGDYCEWYFDETQDVWELLWVIPKEQTVITAFQIDTGTMKFRYKTRQAVCWWAELETDWIDAHEGTDTCPGDATGTGS
jgi:hypothetical protein